MISVLKSLRMRASRAARPDRVRLRLFLLLRTETPEVPETSRPAPAGGSVLLGLLPGPGDLEGLAVARIAPEVVEILVAAEHAGPVEARVQGSEEAVKSLVLLVEARVSARQVVQARRLAVIELEGLLEGLGGRLGAVSRQRGVTHIEPGAAFLRMRAGVLFESPGGLAPLRPVPKDARALPEGARQGQLARLPAEPGEPLAGLGRIVGQPLETRHDGVGLVLLVRGLVLACGLLELLPAGIGMQVLEILVMAKVGRDVEATVHGAPEPFKRPVTIARQRVTASDVVARRVLAVTRFDG